MAIIKPFAALRPTKERAAQVSANPYDSSHPEISQHEFQNNPYSFLHVVKPYMDYPGERKNPAKHFPQGLQYLQKLKQEGTLIPEKKPCFYIYRVIKGSKAYTSIIAAAAVDDYLENRILKHENTLTEKLDALVEHIGFFKNHGNPVLLTYPDNQSIDRIVSKYINTHIPEFNFISFDQMKHNLWVVAEDTDIREIEEAFGSMPSLYIADGHHRSAGAAVHAQNMRKSNAANTGMEGYNFYPVCLIPFSRLHIYEYHRLVKDDALVNSSGFLERFKAFFDVIPSGNLAVQPLEKSEFGIYFNRHAYLLRLKETFKNQLDGTLDELDVSIVEEYILKRIFNVQDSKSDSRLSFLDGSKGIGNIQKSVDNGENSILITLYPTSIEEVKQVAEEGLIMPPKSTWIEPKIRTGLLIYEMD